MSLTLALLNAQSGLAASQEALSVAGNNIANANTDGYSRKVAHFESRLLAGVGSGVRISEIKRRIDEGLLRSLRSERSYLGGIEIKQSFFDRIQSLYGKPSDNSSIAHLLEEVSEAFENLTQAPEKSPQQGEVIRHLRRFGVRMKEMSQSLQDLRAEADTRISEIADRVTFLLGEIHKLNVKIVRNEAVYHDITDLEDKRDSALDELSDYMDVRYYLRNGTEMVIFTPSGETLLDVSPETLTHPAGGQINQTVSHAERSIGPLLLSGSNVDITNLIRTGKLKGLIELRDNILPDMQAELDELSAALRDELNLIHNRTAPYPGLEAVEGTRTFIRPGEQTIQLAGDGDVVIAITDGSGNQVATTTLNTIMVAAQHDDHGHWTINEVMSALQNWLEGVNGIGDPKVEINEHGKVTIKLNSSNRYLVFKDEAPAKDSAETVGKGATRTDVTINFNADGDTNATDPDKTIDQKISGFSNFFGLNDLIVDRLERDRYDSEVKIPSYTWQPTTPVTLTFTDGTQSKTISLSSHGVYSVQDIADAVNHWKHGIPFITARVIPDGEGCRLRFDHDDGRSFVITDDGESGTTTSFLEAFNVKKSNARSAEFFEVRPDIFSKHSLLSRGTLSWDSSRGEAGEYYISTGDNTVANEMSEALTGLTQFETAGSVSARSTTFTKFAESIVSENAARAADNKSAWEDMSHLTQALQERSDSHRGVNLDEEMASLILYQHSYTAAARVISVVDELFDTLQSAV